MRRSWLAAGLVAAAVGSGCGTETTQVRSEGYTGAVVTHDGRVPAGTTIWVRLEDELSAKKSRPGDQFTATVVEPIVAQDGEVLVPRGARVFGHVANLRGAPRGDSPAMIVLALDSIQIGGVNQPLVARIVDTEVKEGPLSGIKTRDVLIGTGLGAVLGGVIEGGEGAIVGGLLGAVAGSAISLGMNRDAAELDEGTRLAIQLERPVRSLAMLRGRRVY